jgi:hypothetical protein
MAEAFKRNRQRRGIECAPKQHRTRRRKKQEGLDNGISFRDVCVGRRRACYFSSGNTGFPLRNGMRLGGGGCDSREFEGVCSKSVVCVDRRRACQNVPRETI